MVLKITATFENGAVFFAGEKLRCKFEFSNPSKSTKADASNSSFEVHSEEPLEIDNFKGEEKNLSDIASDNEHSARSSLDTFEQLNVSGNSIFNF